MKRHLKSPQRVVHIFVRSLSAQATRGFLTFGNLRLACALGRSGRRAIKREGDGATPIGNFALRRVLYRADRVSRPRTLLPVSRIRALDGWCDEPRDRNYNRPVCHPYPTSAEHLWRHDHLYDLIVIMGHNDVPRVKFAGSAVFMHVAESGMAPTAGCVALRRRDLMRLLTLVSRRTRVRLCV